ncbi:MAG TPA: CPBP family intramembrane metalloprotease [Candidatus Fimousia stercorigallinarum]|nr:CPBP family intramembrane metalloprotease [Candidatus Fimousia stercorigallinarum]
MQMQKDPRNVNYYLIVYLILYLCLSFTGQNLFSEKLLSNIVQFLPVVLGILYLMITRQPLLSSVQIRRFHPLTVPCVILFTLCLWPLLSLINLFSMLFSENLIQHTVTGTVSSNGPVYALAVLALIPAIVEEFTFRGIIYGQYRCNRPIKAIFLSALCFGLMHMNFNQFCYAFIIGIFFALIVEASGSLIPSMLMHFTFNAISVLLVYAQQAISGSITETESTQITLSDFFDILQVYLPLTAAGCLLAFFLFYMIAKLNHRDREITSWHNLHAYQMRPNKKLTNLWFYCFVIICLIICMLMELLL